MIVVDGAVIVCEDTPGELVHAIRIAREKSTQSGQPIYLFNAMGYVWLTYRRPDFPRRRVACTFYPNRRESIHVIEEKDSALL